MDSRNITGIVLATSGLFAPAWASGPPDGWAQPTVAHDGIRVMQAEGHTIESRFHYAPPGKHRQEMSQQGMSMAMILREDLGLAWMLMPQGMYMEMPFDEAADEKSGALAPDPEEIIEFERLGTETVNGWPATRYRVVLKDEDYQADGLFWLTEHNIPVRMEIRHSDGSGTVTMDLKDLQIRAQDPSLFELPDGARQLPGFGGAFPIPGRD